MNRALVRIAWNGKYARLCYYDSSGVLRKKSIGAVSAAQAERQRVALAGSFIASPGRADVGKAPRLSQWRAAFAQQRSGEVKENTLALFEETFTRLCDYFPGDPRLDKISRAAAVAFAGWLRKAPRRTRAKETKGPARTLSRQTVSRYLRDCKVIFGHAARQDLIPFNPFDRVEAGAPSVSKEWAQVTRAQLDQLLEALPTAGWRALVALCRLAGLRRGEALRLNWADVDWTGNTLRVLPEANAHGDREEGTKQRERLVPIEPRLKEILREAQESAPEHQLRVCAIFDNNVDRQARHWIKAAGLPPYAKPFHTLRKCLESEWLAKHPIATVCYWLGHAPTVAMRHYHRPTAEEVARVAESGPEKVQSQETGGVGNQKGLENKAPGR